MIVQISIAVTGMIAIWLTQQPKERLKRYACLFGLAGQPFWFYSSYQSGQWGVFALCFGYTWCWLLGFIHHWVDS